MAVLYLPDEILIELLDGKILFTDLEGIARPKINGDTSYKKKKISRSLRWDVFERDNFECVLCKKKKFLTVDHIKPESKGGKTKIDNLQTLCKWCNSKKGVSDKIIQKTDKNVQ